MKSSSLSLYLAYERFGFHIGTQPRMAKAGNGHKPGDYRYRAIGAVEAARMVDAVAPNKQRKDWTREDVHADLRKLNLSVCATPPHAFLDLDGLPLSIANRAFGAGLWRHRTASGGWHVLARIETERLPISNGAIQMAEGAIDVKGMNTGYVIGPGSRTEKGEYHGWVGRVPVLDDDALDTLLAISGGKLAERMVRGNDDSIELPRPPIGTEQVEGACEAIRLGLAGEYPSSMLTGGNKNTYRRWTGMTWSIEAYGGDALYDIWEAESVRFRRLPCLGTSTFSQTWRNMPPSSTGAFFASVVNGNARSRGIKSPLPFYRPPRPPLNGVDITGVATLGV